MPPCVLAAAKVFQPCLDIPHGICSANQSVKNKRSYEEYERGGRDKKRNKGRPQGSKQEGRESGREGERR